MCLALPGPLAAAQPAPAPRQRVNRSVVLSVEAPEPVDTLRLAPGSLTSLVFDAPLDQTSVELEGKDVRIRLVDVGARSLLLEAALELNPSERWLLRVRFLDGAPPERAVFALGSHPTLVDNEVRVSRRAPAPEPCQAELSRPRSRFTHAPSPADFALAGWLGETGVGVLPIKGGKAGQSATELRATGGTVYFTESWVVVLVSVKNPGPQPWVPTQAKLTSPEQNTRAQVRAVRLREPAIPAGEASLIAVEAAMPAVKPGATFSLELADAAGQRTLVLTGVRLKKDGSDSLKGMP